MTEKQTTLYLRHFELLLLMLLLLLVLLGYIGRV